MTIEKFTAKIKTATGLDCYYFYDEEAADYSVIGVKENTKTFVVSFRFANTCDLIYGVNYGGSFEQLRRFVNTVAILMEDADNA